MMTEGNAEIKNVFPADVAKSLWGKLVVLKEQAMKWTKVRVYVYSDSVLCLWKTERSGRCSKKVDWSSVNFEEPTFRELQGLDAEPMNFEWKNFPGATALDILHEIQANLQGKHITPENFSDRIIFMSMFNENCSRQTRKWRFLCSYLTSRKIKEYASNSNGGHWAFLGPGEECKWCQGCATNYGGNWDLRASQMVEDFENPGHRVFRGVSPLGRGILKKKNNRDTIHYNGEYCNIDLLYRTVHSANQLCIRGAVTKWCGTNSEETSQSRLESARKTSPETRIKQEDLKSLLGIPRLPHASGNRMVQSLKDLNSMPFMNKIENLCTAAIFCHPIEKGNHVVTTTLEEDGWRKRTSMCKEYTAPRNREDPRPYASIDAEKETGPVLSIENASIIDVLGIEVQVPSLSSPGYSVWILISHGRDRFVNEIHCHNSDTVNYSSSLRTWQITGKSHKIWTMFKRRLNLQACIGEPLLPRHGKPRPPRKAAAAAAAAAAILRQSKVHLQKDRDHQREQDLDYDSWMPDMQKGFLWNSHLQVCYKYGYTTMTKMNEKQMERGIGMVYYQHWKGKFEINWRKSSRTRIGSNAFILEASRRDLRNL